MYKLNYKNIHRDIILKNLEYKFILLYQIIKICISFVQFF